MSTLREKYGMFGYLTNEFSANHLVVRNNWAAGAMTVMGVVRRYLDGRQVDPVVALTEPPFDFAEIPILADSVQLVNTGE